MKALEVRIRRVSPPDIERIIDIERSWHHLSHWSVDSYYRLLNEDSFTASFVAEIDDAMGRSHIAGFVIYHTTADVCEIYNIAVEAGHARSGIGRQLMAAAIEAARKRGTERVILEVRKSNSPAINFYHGLKFQVIGERKNYYSNPMEDAFVMELETRPDSR